MAYNNPYFYNRDFSVKNNLINGYSYIADLSSYKPVYGSSVSYSSRLNFLETVDNTLKILPSSENNLKIEFKLKFILNDSALGNLLKTIELAGGCKYLKFTDPSSMYKEIIGYVESYSIRKSSNSLNELDISVLNHFTAPIFKWKTSSLLSVNSFSNINWNISKSYKKYDFVYFDQYLTYFTEDKNFSKNKMDNFWFAKKDIDVNTPFSLSDWTRNFAYESKLPFELNNKFDFEKIEYRNSFVQNLKSKNNSNTIKDYVVKFENIDDAQCKSILFFLEKKCGYMRFLYDFPIFLNKNKVFICVKWDHVFKFKDCNDIQASFVEEPNPNIYIDKDNYYHLI
jgi:hypothetical protein